MRLAIFTLLLICFVGADTAVAQDQDRARGRHNLVFDIGLLGDRSVGAGVEAGTFGTRTHAGGVSGGLHYDYRLSEQWAATVRWAVVDARAGVGFGDQNGVDVGSSAGFAILFGAKYFPSIGDDLPIEPFFTLATGPYVHTNSGTRIGRSGFYGGTRSTQALGLFGQVGADWYINHWLKFQAGVGYHAVEGFDDVEGLATNYSGADFTIGMGFRFGR